MSSNRRRHGRGHSNNRPPVSCGTFAVDSNEIPGFRYDPIRNRYFKINDCSHVLSRSVHSATSEELPNARATRGASSLTKMLHLREGGNAKLFSQTVKEIILKGMSGPHKTSVDAGWYPRHCVSCLHLINIESSLASPLAGIWTVDDPTERVYFVSALSLNSKTVCKPCVDEECRSMTLKPLGIPLPFPEGKVTNVCAMMNGILVCQVGSTSIAYYLPRMNLMNDPESRSSQIMLLGKDTVFSCAFNESTQNTAFGMEKGGLLRHWCNPLPTCKLFSEQQSVFCLMFKREGHVLLSGTKNGTIYCTDLRHRPDTHYAYKIKLGHLALCHLDLMQNQNEMLCSGYDNQLLRVDLRTRRPVMHYAEHVNRDAKTRFNVDESMGILCCTGQDTKTRLWDLHSGSLLTTFSCPTESKGDEIPLSLFGTCWGRRSSVPVLVLAHKDQMFVYNAQ